MMATGAEYGIVEVGYLRPIGMEKCEELLPVKSATIHLLNVRVSRVLEIQ